MDLRGAFRLGQMTPQAKTVVRRRMNVQKQITKRSRSDAIIKLQNAAPTVGVHLHQDVSNPRFIARVLEGDDVMRIAIDGLGKLAGREQILRQKQHGDVTMMRVFGKQIQHALVLSPFFQSNHPRPTPHLWETMGSIDPCWESLGQTESPLVACAQSAVAIGRTRTRSSWEVFQTRSFLATTVPPRPSCHCRWARRR